MTEMREPRGPSMAYTMAVGIGRGRPAAASSVASSSAFPAYAGRGAALQARATVGDMANAQKPFEQYLVIVHFHCSWHSRFKLI